MRWTFIILCISFILKVSAQEFRLTGAEVIHGKLHKKATLLREFRPDPSFKNKAVRDAKIGYHPRNDWILHEALDPTALPAGPDPALQRKYPPPEYRKSLIRSFEGMKFSDVNPSDPSIDVGPAHVVQMINGSSGAYLKIYDKSGQVLVDQVYFDSYTGIDGYGDPIVLYDQLAERWLLSEFAFGNNMLIVAISETSDPTGSYFIYSFETPQFPDYPKFALWPDAYYVTTNEEAQVVYALDRNNMLQGLAATSQRFSIPDFQALGFQSATPVGLMGSLPPPEGKPGMIMRMADDAWSEAVEYDRLEIYEFAVDWQNPGNSTFSGPKLLATQPFDTELCGFTAFSCIEQPISNILLDPMREILMNKIGYWNFGSHEALACTHVVDVDQQDKAGVRWYELRNEDEGWIIHQQGTYSPDMHSRWMSAIALNGDGSIGLAYNVSSKEVFPSIRFTGRKPCDPPGIMTLPETTLAEGSGINISNRYGDYNTLAVDPDDGSFWFSGQYNPGLEWETHIGNFEAVNDCYGYRLFEQQTHLSVCSPGTAQFQIELKKFGGFDDDVVLDVEGLPPGLEAVFQANPMVSEGVVYLKIGNMDKVDPGEYHFTVSGIGDDIREEVLLTIGIYRDEMDPVELEYPHHQETELPSKFEFSWQDLPNAEFYQLQVARDPGFSELVIDAQKVQENRYPLPQRLGDFRQYFWRVRGQNLCHEGMYSETYTFITERLSCISIAAEGLPIEISDSGAPVVESGVGVEAVGIVRDVRLNKVDIDHDWVGDLVGELISPAGTIIQLFEELCSSNDDLLLSFSDRGEEHGEIPCPPVDEKYYKPEQAFEAFFGEEMEGQWTFRVSDQVTFDGGHLMGWTLEVCMSDPVENPLIPCEIGEMELEGELASKMYATNRYIQSGGRVPKGGEVYFQALEGVGLGKGFVVEKGAVFEAKIGPCVEE